MMTAWAQEAVNVLVDSTKQLITLSTGTIALTVTLAKDFNREATQRERRLLVTSWLAYFVAIVCGIGVLYAVTGTLAVAADGGPAPSVLTNPTMLLSALQQAAFLGGTLLAIIYGARVAVKRKEK